jgi:uncharacterized RDD family membrane protein YckC
VEYEDRVTIATPEGVDLDLRLAGLGSRFSAQAIDLVIEAVLIIAAGLALEGADAFSEGAVASGVGAAVFSVVFFLVILGYDVLFEVLASGRTPGKRWTGLRVVRTGGEPIRFLASTIRNLFRLIDFLPFSYLVGSISILVTRRNQRLGDLVAGTLVVRERGGELGRRRRRGSQLPPVPAAPPDVFADLPWDVSAITQEELGAVRSFLERREGLTWEARAKLARTLAEQLRAKVPGADASLAHEGFLERLAAVKSARG